MTVQKRQSSKCTFRLLVYVVRFDFSSYSFAFARLFEHAGGRRYSWKGVGNSHERSDFWVREGVASGFWQFSKNNLLQARPVEKNSKST